MKLRRTILGTALAAATAIPFLTAAPATAGGECNPGTVDVNCTYESPNGKAYDCSAWTGSYCLADLSGVLSVHMRIVSYQ